MSERRLKILTFNHHESYLWALAKTGHEFDVVEKVGNLDLSWNPAARKRPDNLNPIAFDQDVQAKLRAGHYDLVIAHTIKNLVWLFPYFKVHFVFVAHIPLFFYSFPLALKSMVKKGAFVLFRLTHRTRFFAVSEFKRAKWGEKGDVGVLTPADTPELEAGEGYDRILVVCNQLAARREELGYDMIQSLAQDMPLTILGNNPGVPHAVKPENFNDFRVFLQRARVYLYTIQQPWGDGYNTAMLEAMAMGMAIVTIHNPSSPIIHGQNGLVGSNTAEIRTHLESLLKDRDLVDRLGAAARETVREKFGQERFIRAWQGTLFAAAREAFH